MPERFSTVAIYTSVLFSHGGAHRIITSSSSLAVPSLSVSYLLRPYELPYDGAKEMLFVEDVDNKKFLTGLFNAMYDELPAPKPKKKK